jgi:hypothetical protein
MSETPSTTGQTDPSQTAAPPEAQRIYDVVSNYHDAISRAYGEDIMNTDAEHYAWVESAEIAQAVGDDPELQLAPGQQKLLASVEAHTDALSTGASLSEQQKTSLSVLNESQGTGGVVHEMARARHREYLKATNQDEKDRLRSEWQELKEYTEIIDDNDGAAEIAGVGSAVKLCRSADPDQALRDIARVETLANHYFAKYTPEIIGVSTSPQENNEGGLTPEAVAAAKRRFQELNISGGQPNTEPDQEQAVEAARDSVEAARSAELFDDIVKFAENKTRLHTDVNGGFSDIGDTTSPNKILVHIPEDVRQRYKSGHSREGSGGHKKLNEVVMFSDVVEEDVHEVERERPVKGRFGRTATERYTVTETVANSGHPVMIHNERTGQDEPMVRFRYKFRLSGGEVSSSGEPLRYQEFRGHRQGQSIAASVDLPKSVADQLREQVGRDPQSMRGLTEQLFLSNSDGAVTEKYWRQGSEDSGNPIRPPYEQLPADWNIAVLTSEETERHGQTRTLKYDVNHVPARA